MFVQFGQTIFLVRNVHVNISKQVQHLSKRFLSSFRTTIMTSKTNPYLLQKLMIQQYPSIIYCWIMANLQAARGQTAKLGLLFLVLFTGVTSYGNIMSYLFQSMNMPNVGPAGHLCRALAHTISSLLASSIPISLKPQLILSVVLCSMNLVCGCFTPYCQSHALVMFLVCLGSTFEGIGIGIYWVAQGRYVHLICEIYDVHDQRGGLFGISQMFYNIAVLSGCIATFILIGYFSFITYFLACTALGILSFVLCFIFIDEIHVLAQNALHQLSHSIESEQQINRQRKVIINILNEETEHVSVDEYSFWQKMTKMVAYVPKIYYVFPFLIVNAISNGIKFNLVPHLVPSSLPKQIINRQAGICQIFMGVGGVIGGYGAGNIADSIGTLWAGSIFLIIFSLECWLFILTTQVENLSLAYLTSFLIGFGLYSLEGTFAVVYSRHLGGSREVFALKKGVFSLAMMAFQGWMTATHNSVSFTAFVIFSLLPIPTIAFLQRLPSAYNPQNKIKE